MSEKNPKIVWSSEKSGTAFSAVRIWRYFRNTWYLNTDDFVLDPSVATTTDETNSRTAVSPISNLYLIQNRLTVSSRSSISAFLSGQYRNQVIWRVISLGQRMNKVSWHVPVSLSHLAADLRGYNVATDLAITDREFFGVLLGSARYVSWIWFNWIVQLTGNIRNPGRRMVYFWKVPLSNL